VSPVVGLVGCGRWGRHILRDLRSLGCDVPVVARSDASKERAREGGASAIVGDVPALAAADGIVVATPTTTHAEVLEEALAFGVPMFCEKPLSHDAAAASRLAKRAPETIFVMDKWRYHPGVRELETIAREERLGRVAGIRTVRIGWGNPHDDVDPVWVLAPHDLAIALEIMGAVPTVETAVGLDLDGELELLEAVLRGEGWWHVLEVSGRSPERLRRVELHCEDGVAVLAGGWDEHVSVFREGADGLQEELIETPGELPLLAELRAFVAHLAGGPPPRTSVADGAAIVAAVEELRRLALAR
jgi:predicted dehydrogenase